MVVYRLLRMKYAATPLSAEGAFRAGGRWNPPGYPILYTSATPELALLEILVHLNPQDERPDLGWVVLEAPEPGILIQANELPPSWYEPNQYRMTQDHLRPWLSRPTCVSTGVPSAVVPLSQNYLLHTAHHDFSIQVHLLDIVPCRLDSRFLQSLRDV